MNLRNHKVILVDKFGVGSSYNVKSREMYNEGYVYKYKIGKQENVVATTVDYRKALVNGNYWIGQIAGEVQAVNIFGLSGGGLGENYQLLLRSHLIADTVKTLRSNKMDWKIMIIIMVVALVLIGGFYLLKGSGGGTSDENTRISLVNYA